MAGTVTLSSNLAAKKGNVGKAVVAWTSDSNGDADGLNISFNGNIRRVVTIPDGSDAPSVDYDIVLDDEDGTDVMAGGLADRHTSNSESVVPTHDTAVYAGLLLPVISNAGDGKSGVIKIYYD